MQGKKKIATTTIIICSLLLVVFFVLYKDYSNTFREEEAILEKYRLVETRLNNTIYKSLKDESQNKVDGISAKIRDDLLVEYDDDISMFEREYSNPKSDSNLVDVISDNLENDYNKYLYIQSENNTMFALTDNHVILDDKMAQDFYTEERTISEYVSGSSSNSKALSKVYERMKLGVEQDLFKCASNTDLQHTSLKEILDKPIDELSSIVFLSYSFIDKDKDLLGNNYSYKSGGINEDSKKIIVVQRFSLYEQAMSRFKKDYTAIETDMDKDLAILKERRDRLALTVITITALIFISFLAISSLQSIEVGVAKRKKL